MCKNGGGRRRVEGVESKTQNVTLREGAGLTVLHLTIMSSNFITRGSGIGKSTTHSKGGGGGGLT